MIENKPHTGSVSCPYLRVNTEKTRITFFLSSCGEYARIRPCLPKYGRFAPRQMTLNGLSTAPVFATYFSPSSPEKGRQNANMRVVFSGVPFFIGKRGMGRTVFSLEGLKKTGTTGKNYAGEYFLLLFPAVAVAH